MRLTPLVDHIYPGRVKNGEITEKHLPTRQKSKENRSCCEMLTGEETRLGREALAVPLVSMNGKR